MRRWETGSSGSQRGEGLSVDVGPCYALRGYSENLGGHSGITVLGVVLGALVGKQNLCQKYSNVWDSSAK